MTREETQERPMTTEGSHTAVKRGYAGGAIVKVGDVVPAGVAISDFYNETYRGWMVPSTDAEAVAESIALAASEEFETARRAE